MKINLCVPLIIFAVIFMASVIAEDGKKVKSAVDGYGPVETYMYARIKAVRSEFTFFWEISNDEMKKHIRDGRKNNRYDTEIKNKKLDLVKSKKMQDKDFYAFLIKNGIIFEDLMGMSKEKIESITTKKVNDNKVKIYEKTDVKTRSIVMEYDKENKIWYIGDQR